MKPEETKQDEEGEELQVTGDVIGDTAYSERFVLKILIKLANLDSLKIEIQEKSFEDDLCTLWDMTTERDVVLFLQKHDILNLFYFALPVLESPRLIEIIIGIVGNMCCQKEVVHKLMESDEILLQLVEFIKSDDSLVLVQIFRLISSCLFVTEDIPAWLEIFNKLEYSNTLYFILKNSSNKDLLITCLENYNTVSTICNIETGRSNFFSHFVTLEALESLNTAFIQITVKQKDECDRDEIERILVICLQMTLNLIGFDKSLEIYSEKKELVTSIVEIIFKYYETKFVDQKEIDSDFIDIIDSTITIVKTLNIECCSSQIYFDPSYNIWKIVKIVKTENTNRASFEEDCNIEEVQEFSKQIIKPLSNLLCIYLDNCTETELNKTLNQIRGEYEEIVNFLDEGDLKTSLTQKAASYMESVKQNGHS